MNERQPIFFEAEYADDLVLSKRVLRRRAQRVETKTRSSTVLIVVLLAVIWAFAFNKGVPSWLLVAIVTTFAWAFVIGAMIFVIARREQHREEARDREMVSAKRIVIDSGGFQMNVKTDVSWAQCESVQRVPEGLLLRAGSQYFLVPSSAFFDNQLESVLNEVESAGCKVIPPENGT